MDSSDTRPGYLAEIELVTARDRFRLGGPPVKTAASDLPPAATTGSPSKAQRRLTLAGEAMRWTYVLRSRERWKGDERALAQQERSAAETLYAFGLDDDALQKISQAGRVMVEMPFHGDSEAESTGWPGRIFPWEFVLASATRRYRNGARLTVMRHLPVASKPGRPTAAPQPRVLFVQSRPGAVASAYSFDDEAQRVRTALGLRRDDPRWLALNSPTLQELAQAAAAFRPEIIHLAGCDNHQGVRLVRDHGGARTRVWYGERGEERWLEASDFLEVPDHAIDGYLLRHERGAVRVTSPEELGEALTADGQHQPFLVSLNLWNSAARTAPLLLAGGALSAIGFQDALDDALSEYFYEAFYTALRADWNLPAAFEAAWGALRSQPDLGPGTGIVLWGRAPLIGKPARAQAPQAVAAPVVPPVAVPIECRIEPKKDLNYSVLHNHGALFEKFELHVAKPADKPIVHVLVELHCGSEQARYASALTLDQARVPLVDKVRIPLTASLMRSVSEAVQSSLYVHVEHDGKTVLKDTYPLRLLPVDQWLDNARSGQWLPSFVLPRDPAVQSAITAAQRYVRVIRDDPAAGFEGYQAAAADDPESLEQVDLQVEAIWAALLHEWRLGYINPPPTYADTAEGVQPLDSQRLRTPSDIRRAEMGTCIDLALLFAACLELVDIYPVIFLLDGHALPGYWRHHDFQAQYREDPAPGEAMAGGDARRNTAPGAQAVPWKVGKSGWREVRKQIRLGRLVPLETVRLTEHGSFREAIRAGAEALAEEADFDSILDIIIARRPHNVTPLPIIETEARP